MIYVSIFAFVLALTACVCGAAALIISLRLKPGLERWQSRTESDLTKLAQRIERQSESASSALQELRASTPTRIAAEVAALAGALDSLAAQHRKLSGQFHATKTRANAETDGIDDELQAVLALQTAKSPAPGQH